MSGKVILLIMDGWGIAREKAKSAIDNGLTPFFDHSLLNYPNSRLQASETAVGLPKGQMGNSEVGHMNIGAGRIVYQDLARISRSLDSGEFASIPAFRELTLYCRSERKPLHIMGLLSDGGVHSHIDHLKGIISLLAHERDFPPVYVHAFMDGRDTDPKSGLDFVQDLEAHLSAACTGKIATIIGRYFAMDRNRQWDRTKRAYDLIVRGIGKEYRSATEAIMASYHAGVTDEFMEPAVIVSEGDQGVQLQEGDAVLFFNFRTDRGRQLTEALSQKEFPELGMQQLRLHYCTMARYDENFKNIEVLFQKENIQMGLGEVLAKNGKKQIRIAETEKYPHVTYFFNGGREEPFEGESRILRPSPRVATYDLKPEMSAFEIRDAIIVEIKKAEVDFVCLNFANPDMVGHTGVFEAAIKACEIVDACTEAVVRAGLAAGYAVVVTADHGNADCMVNSDGSPHTAHTTALVPLILYDPEDRGYKLRDGKLGDIAPTILQLMRLPIPPEMTGEVLLSQ